MTKLPAFLRKAAAATARRTQPGHDAGLCSVGSRRLVASDLPKYSLVGDIAVLPPGADHSCAQALLSNRVRVVAIKEAPCSGQLRAPTLRVLAGEPRLETTHAEWGLRFRLDLGTCFFTPRLQAERQRVCGRVRVGERVLVLFSGVGIWPVTLAAHTPAREVVGVEVNPSAHAYALANAQANRSAGGKVKSVLADVADVPQLGLGTFDRVVAPRPKDLTTDAALAASLPAVLGIGGHLHLYGFATAAELELEQTDLATANGSRDLARLLALTGDDRPFELLRIGRCPRAPIGREGGRSLFRVALDMRRGGVAGSKAAWGGLRTGAAREMEGA